MESPVIAIISDEEGFASAITKRWQSEREVPSFYLLRSNSSERLDTASFDVAVLGHIDSDALHRVIEALERSGKPVIFVSRMNGHSPRGINLTALPEVEEWPDLVLALAKQILLRQRADGEVNQLASLNSKLEQQASLGRYMVEMRHNFNNALTSILGNSDLILLDQEELPPAVRSQVETIRNMGMRMNEIMQRFSSLQKEMQLMEQQSLKRAAKAAGV